MICNHCFVVEIYHSYMKLIYMKLFTLAFVIVRMACVIIFGRKALLVDLVMCD